MTLYNKMLYIICSNIILMLYANALLRPHYEGSDRAFMKGWALGKLTGCGDETARLTSLTTDLGERFPDIRK